MTTDDRTKEIRMIEDARNDAGYARGRDEERAMVVSYLRACGYRVTPAEIERGEHWAGHECLDAEPCSPDIGDDR